MQKLGNAILLDINIRLWTIFVNTNTTSKNKRRLVKET